MFSVTFHYEYLQNDVIYGLLNGGCAKRVVCHSHQYPWPLVAPFMLSEASTGQRPMLVTLRFLHMAGLVLRDSLSSGRINGARSDFVDKRGRIYEADAWVMDPDCDHGVASATPQSRIIDFVLKNNSVSGWFMDKGSQ